MCSPTAQEFHSTVRFDDPGIADDDRLLRHICIPVQVVVEKNGSLRISDQAFKQKRADPGTSVDIECLLHLENLTENDRRGAMPHSYGLLAITAGNARQASRGVAWTPKPEEPELTNFAALPNPFHGEIVGPISKSDYRALAARAIVVWVKSELDLGPFSGQNPAVGG